MSLSFGVSPLTLSPDSPLYPNRFHASCKALTLHALGDISLLSDSHLLGIIGSRNMTSYGRHILGTFIPKLHHSIIIVSGFSRGVDTYAHQLALQFGLKTVALLPSGLFIDYPSGSTNLKKAILNSGGLLISPFLDNQTPAKWTFPIRNRLLACLVDAILVVEARLKSGSLMTASFACDLNVPLLAVPGSIFSEMHAGTLQLLKSSAKCATSASDINNIFGLGDTNTSPVALDLTASLMATVKRAGSIGISIPDLSKALSISRDRLLLLLMPLYVSNKVKRVGDTLYDMHH